MKAGATFDPTGTYRYSLLREWDARLPRIAFVMLNPSVADAEQDDPTIRRCIGFAQAWGYGSLEAVNLFAYRTPYPAVLRAAADPVGPDNDRFLHEAACRARMTVVAWGNHGAHRGRDEAVIRLLFAAGGIHCLGLTGAGHPCHPLRLPGHTTPAPLPVGGCR